jgi:nicotinamidase-related amidase
VDKFILNKDTSALVVVDIQEKLVPAMKKRQQVYDNCGHLIELAKLIDLPIVLTEQYPKGLGPTVPEIKDVLPSYTPLEKVTFDCCRGEGFLDTIASLQKTHIILTGMETHICVLQTCLSLLNEGYFVHLVSDAVCSRKKQDFRTAVETMRDAGAVINCTETALFQLLEKAGTPEFKAISKRIK